LMDQGRVVGTVSSGDWGHRTGLNLAYAFVDPAFAAIGTTCEIDVLGDMIKATVITPSPYDPKLENVRA
jgi:dimethylglycine dehydrogenase